MYPGTVSWTLIPKDLKKIHLVSKILEILDDRSLKILVLMSDPKNSENWCEIPEDKNTLEIGVWSLKI